MPHRKLILVAAAAAILLIIVLALSALLGGGASPGGSDGTDPGLFPDTSGFVICLDPGHGDHDPGSISPDGARNEKDDNLALALAVRDILLAEIAALPQEDDAPKITVIMTREDDSYPDLTQRCDFANQGNASVFVSLHRNSGGGTGVEVWVHSQAAKADKELGKAILDRIVGAGVNKNRGLRTGTAANAESNYKVNSGTNMPSCIVELGFIDSQSDNDLFDINMQAYAEAIAQGILSLVP